MDDGGDITRTLSSGVSGVREQDGEEEQDESEEETSDGIVCRKVSPVKSGDEGWHCEVPAFEHK